MLQQTFKKMQKENYLGSLIKIDAQHLGFAIDLKELSLINTY